MRFLVHLLALTVVPWSTTGQRVPAELLGLLAKAQLEPSVADWCRGQFRAHESRGYAVALTADSGGRYVVIDMSGTLVELAPFSGSADLSCYTPAEIRALDRSMRQSETIHGQVVAVAGTTVACGFVDNTTAICWQYSAAHRRFLKVGQWVT